MTAEGTTLARLAGEAGSNPLTPVHISAAFLTFPTTCHISAFYHNSDMISLDKHDRSFLRQVINYRKDIWFDEQGGDGSPPQQEETHGGFLTKSSISRVSTVGGNRRLRTELARGNSSQSCMYRAISARQDEICGIWSQWHRQLKLCTSSLVPSTLGSLARARGG